jgi:two-component system alkaline phosphatase synthesis response regulator PhoP
MHNPGTGPPTTNKELTPGGPDSSQARSTAGTNLGTAPHPVTPPAEGPDLRVLVVEDEPLTRRSLRAALLKGGFTVSEADSGEEALGLFDQDPPDVVILDIGLPGLNGFEVCQRIRSKREDTAILMLTVRADPEDKITGLELGADDYLVKPFNPGELVARIRAVLRRTAQRPPSDEPLVFKDLCLDFQTQTASRAGIPVNLSPREFTLLAALLRHPGQVMSRDQLAREVWGGAPHVNTRALDVFVCKLREKIEPDPARPQYVRTARGAGYVAG